MRVLWIAPNGGNYYCDSKGSGGWVAALESAIIQYLPDIELGIVFTSHDDVHDKKNKNVTYLPVRLTDETILSRWINHSLFRYKQTEAETNQRIIQKIQQFKPDVVHIWGTESFYFGAIEHIACPCVVHIQGFVSVIKQFYMPRGYKSDELKRCDGFLNNVILRRGNYFFYKYFCYRAEEEVRLSKYIKNWIGRTDWDHSVSGLLSPGAKYFHCDELIREVFTKSQWVFHYTNHLHIFTIIGDSWYKGMEQILQTALILKEQGEVFTWNVCGVGRESNILSYFERKTGINADSVNIKFLGKLTADEVCRELLDSDVYVHSSHIENSCNSIAEAMSLGVPTVAEYVGGNPTIVKTGGILVQPYSPNNMASAITKMKCPEMANQYSIESRAIASERHDSNRVVESLIEIYSTVLNGRKE